MMNDLAICSDPGMLDSLRGFLFAGLILTAGLLGWEYTRWYLKPNKQQQAKTYCPLHRTNRDECESKHED